MKNVMKALLAIIVVLAIVMLLGWVTISRDGNETDVNVNRETIEEDTQSAAETTKEAAGAAVEKGKELVDEAKKTEVDIDVNHDNAP